MIIQKVKDGGLSSNPYKELDKRYYHCDFDNVRPANRRDDVANGSIFSGYQQAAEIKKFEREEEAIDSFFKNKKEQMEELYFSYEDLLKSELKYYKGRKNWSSLADLMATVKSRCPYCGSILHKNSLAIISHGGKMVDTYEETTVDTGIELKTEDGYTAKVQQKVRTPVRKLVGATYDDWSTTNFDCEKCNKTIISEKSFDMSYEYSYGANPITINRKPQVYRKFLEQWYTPKLKAELPDDLFNYIDRPYD